MYIREYMVTPVITVEPDSPTTSSGRRKAGRTGNPEWNERGNTIISYSSKHLGNSLSAIKNEGERCNDN